MEKPDYFHAKPKDILDWLRTQFPEDVLHRLYWHIGDNAVTEALEDVRVIAARDTPGGGLVQHVFALTRAMDEMDPAQGGGHYPGKFMCGKHTKCPGYPKCKGPHLSQDDRKE